MYEQLVNTQLANRKTMKYAPKKSYDGIFVRCDKKHRPEPDRVKKIAIYTAPLKQLRDDSHNYNSHINPMNSTVLPKKRYK